MKKQIIFLILFILIIIQVNADMDLGLNVSSDGDINADINLYTKNKAKLDIMVNTNGSVTYNTTYNNYQFYDKFVQVTERKTNKHGILRTIINLFKLFFSQEDNPDEDEQEALYYMNLYKQSIINEMMYQAQIQEMQLELLAQRKINQELTKELDIIKDKLNISKREHSLECIGYINVMKEREDINSVTCIEKNNKTTVWHKENKLICTIN